MFEVHVCSMGRMPLPGPEVFWMQAWDEWFEAQFLMVVARNDEHTVVINCGPPPNLEPLNALWEGLHPSGKVQFSRDESETPEAALRSLDISPDEVTHVVITPMVSYALGNLPIFNNAEFVLSRRGWIEDVFAPHHAYFPRSIYMPDDITSFLLFEAGDRYRLVADGDEVVPGIRVWEAGVHHRSSLAVCLETESGTVIATDSAFSYRNVEENILLGVTESHQENLTTYERLRREADILIPMYESEVLKRHPTGRIA